MDEYNQLTLLWRLQSTAPKMTASTVKHWPDHDDVISVNLSRVTGPLSGEFTGDRWISLTKASEAELWNFFWSAPEQTAE